MAIRSPFHALITYPLQYGVRIATPVCALARNDMLLSHIKINLSDQRTIPSYTLWCNDTRPAGARIVSGDSPLKSNIVNTYGGE